MGRERSIEIVDGDGNVVLTLDGDSPGGIRAMGGILLDERCVVWPLLAGSLSSYVWTSRFGVWSVMSFDVIVSAGGGTGATVDLLACSGLTAIGDGISQLDAVLDVEITGPAKALGAVIATPTLLHPGDSLAIAFDGTLTALVGSATICMKRVG